MAAGMTLDLELTSDPDDVAKQMTKEDEMAAETLTRTVQNVQAKEKEGNRPAKLVDGADEIAVWDAELFAQVQARVGQTADIKYTEAPSKDGRFINRSLVAIRTYQSNGAGVPTVTETPAPTPSSPPVNTQQISQTDIERKRPTVTQQAMKEAAHGLLGEMVAAGLFKNKDEIITYMEDIGKAVGSVVPF